MTRLYNNISSLRTVGTFLKKGACSETLQHVLNQADGHPLTNEERASALLAGGIMQHGYQCGMIWGAALAVGAKAYRLYGAGPEAEMRTLNAARQLVSTFHKQNHEINCLEITEIDRSSTTMQMIVYFLIKGGTIHCFRMATKYAPDAFNDIDTTLAEPAATITSGPVSCAALLAKKLGSSDLHATMASGLAGGIGLCGGACGALATAIWLEAIRRLDQGEKFAYRAPFAQEIIDKFLKCTDYEFECEKIVGRKFNDIPDHADFVCNGGCAKILETLAECVKSVR